MFSRRVLPVALTLSMTLLQVVPASAFPGAGISRGVFLPMATRMQEQGRTVAPFGHVEFCSRNPGECRREGVRSDTASLSTGSWRMLQQVNVQVNAAIAPQSDAARGQIDKWSLAQDKGDCEDYALTKRYELIRRGWSPSSVLLATVRDQRNRPHAVLVARTDRGDFVLDNMTGAVKAWDDTGYTWLKRQSSSNPRIWVSLTAEESVRPSTGNDPVARAPKDSASRQAYLLAALNKIRGRSQVASAAHSETLVAPVQKSRSKGRKTQSSRASSRNLVATLNAVRNSRAVRSTRRQQAEVKQYGSRWRANAFGSSLYSRT